jgi:hypothetical protein
LQRSAAFPGRKQAISQIGPALSPCVYQRIRRVNPRFWASDGAHGSYATRSEAMARDLMPGPRRGPEVPIWGIWLIRSANSELALQIGEGRRLTWGCRCGRSPRLRQRRERRHVAVRRESVRCWAMSSPRPKRSSNSRTRMRPPWEVTRDPWKSTFREALKQSWNGWFCLSPTGCEPPERLRRNQTRINIDADEHPKIHKCISKWKCRLKRSPARLSVDVEPTLISTGPTL